MLLPSSWPISHNGKSVVVVLIALGAIGEKCRATFSAGNVVTAPDVTTQREMNLGDFLRCRYRRQYDRALTQNAASRNAVSHVV